MRKDKYFIKKYINSRYDIPGYEDESLDEALIKASYVLNNVSNLSVKKLKEILPNRFIIKFGIYNLTQGNVLLRSRLMGVSRKILKDAGYWGKSEFWEAPAQCVKSYGRLNEPGESVFYLSNNPLQTFKEIRYQVENNREQAVILSSYKLKKYLKANVIGKRFDNVTDPGEVYSNMIHKLFSYPSERYGDNVYKISNYLSNFYLDNPQNLNALAYPPVDNEDERVMNFAFKPKDAHEYLEYNGSIVIPDYKHIDLNNFAISMANDKYFRVADDSVDVWPWVKENFLMDFTGEN